MTDTITPLSPPAPSAQPQTDLSVSRSSVGAIGGTLAGASLILVSGFLTLMRLYSARDIDAIQQWVDVNGLAFFAALSTLVSTVVWRVIAAIRRHRTTVIAADPTAPAVQVKG